VDSLQGSSHIPTNLRDHETYITACCVCDSSGCSRLVKVDENLNIQEVLAGDQAALWEDGGDDERGKDAICE
jgi:hypothetical protein